MFHSGYYMCDLLPMKNYNTLEVRCVSFVQIPTENIIFASFEELEICWANIFI